MATIELVPQVSRETNVPDLDIPDIELPPLPPTITTADILDLTADELDRHGWIRRKFRNQAGEHCTVGAMYEVLNRLGLRRKDLMAVREGMIYETCQALNQTLTTKYSSHVASTPPDWVTVWNDYPGQTQESVVSAIREAARQARRTQPCAD